MPSYEIDSLVVSDGFTALNTWFPYNVVGCDFRINIENVLAASYSNAGLALVFDGADYCCHQTQHTNTPENIDRFLGGKMPGPQDLNRLAIRSWVSVSRERSNPVSRLP